MSLQEFKDYVTNSGVNFDELDNVGKFAAREQFDRYRGKSAIPMTNSIHPYIFKYTTPI